MYVSTVPWCLHFFECTEALPRVLPSDFVVLQLINLRNPKLGRAVYQLRGSRLHGKVDGIRTRPGREQCSSFALTGGRCFHSYRRGIRAKRRGWGVGKKLQEDSLNQPLREPFSRLAADLDDNILDLAPSG